MFNKIKEIRERSKLRRKEKRMIKYIKKGEKIYGKMIWGKTLDEMEKTLDKFANGLNKQLDELNY